MLLKQHFLDDINGFLRENCQFFDTVTRFFYIVGKVRSIIQVLEIWSPYHTLKSQK